MAPLALFFAIPVDVADAQPVYVVDVNDERVLPRRHTINFEMTPDGARPNPRSAVCRAKIDCFMLSATHTEQRTSSFEDRSEAGTWSVNSWSARSRVIRRPSTG